MSVECPTCGSPMPSMYPSIPVEDGELITVCPDEFHADREKIEAYEKFIQEQFDLFKVTNDKIAENVIKYHRDTCEDASDVCETKFTSVFMLLFQEKLRQEKEKLDKKNIIDPMLN